MELISIKMAKHACFALIVLTLILSFAKLYGEGIPSFFREGKDCFIYSVGFFCFETMQKLKEKGLI